MIRVLLLAAIVGILFQSPWAALITAAIAGHFILKHE